MVNPELTGTFAFYGSILLAKMGLMGPLTARQRFRKMVKVSNMFNFPISDHMTIRALITGICKPRGYNLWGNCRLCWLRCWACSQSSSERPREHSPLLFGHSLLPVNQPFNCCGNQLDQRVHRSEVHPYICLLEPGQLQKVNNIQKLYIGILWAGPTTIEGAVVHSGPRHHPLHVWGNCLALHVNLYVLEINMQNRKQSLLYLLMRNILASNVLI